MRKRIASRLGIYPIIFYIFAVSATVLRTLALFFDYEPENGYFAAGSYFTTAAAAAIAAGAVLLLPLLLRREARFTPVPEGSLHYAAYIPAVPLAAAFLFLSVSLLPYAKSDNRVLAAVTILAAICGVAAFLSFILRPSTGAKESDMQSYLSVAGAMFFAFFAMFLYFSSPYPLNAPNIVTGIISSLLAALFMLCEARIYLGRLKSRLYLTVGLMCSGVLLYSALPEFIYCAATGVVVCYNIEQTLLFLLFAIYSAFAAFRLAGRRAAEISPLALEIDNNSAAAEQTEKTADVKAEEVSEVKAEEVSEAKAEKAPEAKAEEVPEAKAEEVPEAKVEEVSEAKAEKAPEAKAEKVTEAKAEELPEAKTEEVTEAKAEEVAEAKVEEVSEVKAEEVPETKAEENKYPEETAGASTVISKPVTGSRRTGSTAGGTKRTESTKASGNTKRTGGTKASGSANGSRSSKAAGDSKATGGARKTGTVKSGSKKSGTGDSREK